MRRAAFAAGEKLIKFDGCRSLGLTTLPEQAIISPPSLNRLSAPTRMSSPRSTPGPSSGQNTVFTEKAVILPMPNPVPRASSFSNPYTK